MHRSCKLDDYTGFHLEIFVRGGSGCGNHMCSIVM